MKIAIVCGAGILGGKEAVTLELAQGLRSRGCIVDVVTSLWGNGDFEHRMKRLGFSLWRMRLGFISATLRRDCLLMTANQLGHWLGLIHSYYRFLRSAMPECIIHTNWQHLLLLWPLLKPERDCFWVHECMPNKTQYRWLFCMLSKRLRCFIVVSHAVADALQRIGVHGDSIQVIHNGLEDPWDPSAMPVGGTSAIRIGIVGQVGAWKGHEDLLEAFGCIAEQYPTAELHIFGSGAHEFESKLKARAAVLQIAARVIWHGFVCDRATIYSSLDVCAVPSRIADSLPTVAIEAAFFGLPVVATRNGGLPEIIDHEVTGFLVEGAAPQQLAQRLEELIANPELRARMSVAARMHARANFSREEFVGKFLTLLDRRGSGRNLAVI